MLRLVHPAPAGQGTDPPARRKGARAPSLSLTPDEARHVRAALHNARRAFGSWGCLAAVVGCGVNSLKQSRPGLALAVRVAQAAGVSVEAMLSGALTAAGRCPTCGHRAGDGRIAAAGGAR
ncbi:MAG: transcriptional regulator [Minicystis sp.]